RIICLSCVLIYYLLILLYSISFFFFIVPPTTEIYTLSLHDALPISRHAIRIPHVVQKSYSYGSGHPFTRPGHRRMHRWPGRVKGDRKSTRLNSSHRTISYAVFCLKKKKKKYNN